MSSQGTLFAPVGPTRTETPTFPAKLLARSTDPPSSHDAAARVAPRLVDSQRFALDVIRRYGRPGTLRQIADALAVAVGWGPIALYHELERRVPELERLTLVRVPKDYTKACRCQEGRKTRCRCQDVRVEGSRVWEVAPCPS